MDGRSYSALSSIKGKRRNDESIEPLFLNLMQQLQSICCFVLQA